MSMVRFFTGLVAAMFIASTGHAAPPQKAELLSTAAAGAAACAKHMPNLNAVGPALAEAGLRLREANGHWRVYVDRSNRVVVGITPQYGSMSYLACAVAANGMTPEEARVLIQPWIEQAGAKPIQPDGSAHRWLGKFGHSVVVLALAPRTDIAFINGAGIAAVFPN